MSHKVNCWKKILFVPALGVFCWLAAWRARRRAITTAIATNVSTRPRNNFEGS